MEMRDGVLKRFDGWFESAIFEGSPYDFSEKMPAKNLNLYGKWTMVEADVVFHQNDHHTADDVILVQTNVIGTTAKRIANPVRNDFVFDGWYISRECWDEDEFDFSTPLTDNILEDDGLGGAKKLHLYAKWHAAVPYTVVYDANGGALTESLKALLTSDNADKVTHVHGSQAAVRGVAEKDGEVFIGWGIGGENGALIQSGNTFEANAEADKADGTEDQVIHLVAKYEKKVLTTKVVYHSHYPDGIGDVTKEVEGLLQNGTCTILSPDDKEITFPTRYTDSYGLMYSFLGWTTDKNAPSVGGKIEFHPHETAAAGQKDNDLYAIWIVVESDVTIAKIWDDADNQDGIRPASITVHLLLDGSVVDTVVLQASSHWQAEINVNVYSDMTRYTVEEAPVPSGYVGIVSGTASTGFTVTVSTSVHSASAPYSRMVHSVRSTYGRLAISPVICSSRPFFKTGPIISKAEINCELTFPGISRCPPFRAFPFMRSGGKPSSPTYSMSAPKYLRASTRIPIGRCFILSVPVITCSPSFTLK